MNKYELMVLLSPDIGGDKTKKRLEEVRKLIASQKGEVVFEDDWGMRDLAYNIKKHDRGYYFVANFTMDPSEGDLEEIDKTFRLENDILRHMIVKVPNDIEAKTLSQYEKEAAEEQAEWEAKKEKEQTKKAVRNVTKKREEKAKKEEAPKKAAEPKAAKKKEAEEKETSLEDVDAKLKSIIDNPDLNF